ncbi:TdeIII family type II restriction endonuclease [Bacteroides clarus]|uniref:TdeIII family type II restriction endonuclease n=1 Tax=Bacteroides clarus TaxID=626929 RepID=UPI001896CA38|nr:TdeIII family type II restriction endonuclease [Bacteroides clarus]
MAISNQKKEQIAEVVIKILYSRFESFPQDASGNRNAPFHEAFLNAFSDKFDEKVTDIPFFISMSSWLHGLNTTMGQTFFESVAHILSDGDKREFTSGAGRAGVLQITSQQKKAASDIITKLSNSEATPNLDNSNSLLFVPDTPPFTNAIDFSADVFLETNDEIIAIELKSVKPNSGEMRGEKQKILEGKAALYRHYPGKDIKFYIGFPFDPTTDPNDPTSYDKVRFTASIINMDKYFDHREVLLASELWDYLSGDTSTMEQILSIINSIATPTFMADFAFLCDNSNRKIDKQRYRQLLEKWHLASELEVLDNQEAILEKIGTNKRLQKVYYKSMFCSNKSYNKERALTLMRLL